jgi:hypothetical protein
MELQTRIESELALGRRAAEERNAGRTRVCARRAAGVALKAWYQALEGPGWSGDAMKQLGRLLADETAPAPARAAAERLRTRVDHDHQLPFTNDPLEDAGVIIAWALEKLAGQPGPAVGR